VRELESLASSLLQSIHYGTPIADALRTIAADSRDGQVAEMEEKAGAISARVGIPLVVLILFPLVALIVAPAAINLMRTF
jgi:tight adherence protein C